MRARVAEGGSTAAVGSVQRGRGIGGLRLLIILRHMEWPAL